MRRVLRLGGGSRGKAGAYWIILERRLLKQKFTFSFWPFAGTEFHGGLFPSESLRFGKVPTEPDFR